MYSYISTQLKYCPTTGVYWCKTRENWRVVLANKTLGRFSTLLDACCCRITANFTNGYNNTHGKI